MNETDKAFVQQYSADIKEEIKRAIVHAMSKRIDAKLLHYADMELNEDDKGKRKCLIRSTEKS